MEQAQKWFGETSRIPADLLQVSQKFDRYLRAPIGDVKSVDFMISAQDIKEAQGVMDFQVDQKLMSNRMEVAPFIDMAYVTEAEADLRAGKHPPLDQIKVAR
jgi:hypothetical protein